MSEIKQEKIVLNIDDLEDVVGGGKIRNPQGLDTRPGICNSEICNGAERDFYVGSGGRGYCSVCGKQSDTLM